jgi:broad specificity phosphatase PhoE
LVSHGGVISVLRKYLIGNNYQVDDSLMNSRNDFWEVRNCSITEIQLGEKGAGKFIRMGDWGHILQEGTAACTKERLENSTG